VLDMTPSSQGLEPATFPDRFSQHSETIQPVSRRGACD
jgi:hypothetical protein